MLEIESNIERMTFHSDVKRGKWLSIWDYFWGCIVGSFGIRTFSIPLLIMKNGGEFPIIQCVLTWMVFGIPTIFIQSYLGQFSSSSFISTFRTVPLFKGLGFTIVLFNLITATFLSQLTVFPFLYMCYSLTPTMIFSKCQNPWNTPNCVGIDLVSNTTMNIPRFDNFLDIPYASSEYFYRVLYEFNNTHEHFVSWQFLFGNFLIWILAGFLIAGGTERIGTIYRFIGVLLMSIFFVIFVYFLFLPGNLVFGIIGRFLRPNLKSLIDVESWILSCAMVGISFGPGWGTILSLASHNKFTDNLKSFSLYICCSNLVILIVAALNIQIVFEYLMEYHGFSFCDYMDDSMEFIYSTLPHAFGGNRIWIFLFFGMIFFGELCSCILLIHSTLTALTDEFEKLRNYKKSLLISIIVLLIITSIIYLVIEHGLVLVSLMYSYSGAIQMLICFLEFVTIGWFYGKNRFDYDIKIMTKSVLPTSMIGIAQVLVPIFSIWAMSFYIAKENIQSQDSSNFYPILTTILTYFPITIAIFYHWKKLCCQCGSCCNILQKLCQPKNWYPADPNARNQYENY